MDLITTPFGGIINAVLALAVVLVAIVLVLWLLKRLSGFSGNAVRGRERRLLVVDTLAIDQKRQLVIIRRDNVEHLILTGGPQDMLVESGIPVDERPAAPPTRRPLPVVPQRKVEPKPAPEPTAPVPPVSTKPLPKAEPGTVLEALRQAGNPGDRKTRVSIRHTGLLRPVSAQDPTVTGQNPDISTGFASDSAKDNGTRTSESATLEYDPSNEPNRG